MYTTLIDTDTLYQHLHDSDWRIFDCRFSLADSEQGHRAYNDAHIPNAVYAHLNEDLSSRVIPGVTGRHPLPDVETVAHTFSQWGIDNHVQVIVYDDNVGQVASRLWWMLRWLGHDAVAVLDGGWARWQQEGRPETADVPTPSPRSFIPHIRPHMIADIDRVQAVLDDPAYRLLDARVAGRYRGEHEPIDPVAGHIPNALCAPFEENIEDGRMRSKEAIRDRFQTLLGDVDMSRVICYCGSGVSACHNLLAMAHAGLEDAKLYPGSWSEWITSPERPIATTDN